MTVLVCIREQVVSCLRRLEILELEEKNRRRHQQQQQQQQQQGGQPATGRSKDGSRTGTVTAGGGVSPRQLALVEMKLQVLFVFVCVFAVQRVPHVSSGPAFFDTHWLKTCVIGRHACFVLFFLLLFPLESARHATYSDSESSRLRQGEHSVTASSPSCVCVCVYSLFDLRIFLACLCGVAEKSRAPRLGVRGSSRIHRAVVIRPRVPKSAVSRRREKGSCLFVNWRKTIVLPPYLPVSAPTVPPMMLPGGFPGG